MIFYPISALINAITSTILCIVVITRNPRSKLNRSFSYFATSVAFWAYCYFVWQISDNANDAIFWCRVFMIGAIFIPPTFLQFSVTLIGQRKEHLKSILVCYIISGVFLLVNCTPFFVRDVSPRLGFAYWPTAGILYAPFIGMYVGLITYAHVLMYKSYCRLSGIERNQIKYIFVGTAIGFLGGSTNYFLWYDIPIPPIGNVCVAIYVFLVAYSIIKYRLMDIRLAVTKAGVFLVVYVPVFGMPLFYMGYHLGLWEQATWAILILMIIGHYAHSYLQKQAENYLFAEQRRYQDILQKAARGINRIKELDKLLNLTIHILSRAMHLVSCSAYIYDSKSDQYILKAHRGLESHQLTNIVESKNHMITQLESSKFPIVLDEVKARVSIEKEGILNEIIEAMESLNVEVVIPCISKVQPIAFMILGKKKSGKLYSESDLTTFSILSSQVALAIENCIYLQETGSDLSQKFQQQRLSGLGVLATGISHQLNNRFNAIVVNCGLSLKTEEKASVKNFSKEQVIEKFKECMKKIKSIALDAKSVTEAVQNYSKAKADAEVLMFDDIVNDAYGLVRLKHEGLQFEFVKEYSMDILIWAGRAALQDAIYNAIDNSCYAMKLKMKEIDDYRPRISIRGFVKGKMVRLEIEDNGKGIKEEDMKKLFTPLFTTKGHNEGTGLGLSVIMDLIQKNSGTIKMESTYGVGTKTIITIPRATEEQVKNKIVHKQ